MNVSRDVVSAASPGNQFWCFTTLIIKNLMPTPNQNQSSVTFTHYPWSHHNRLSHLSHSPPSNTGRPQKALPEAFSRLNKPISASQERCCIPLIISVALLRTSSNRSLCFLSWGAQTWKLHLLAMLLLIGTRIHRQSKGDLCLHDFPALSKLSGCFFSYFHISDAYLM